MASNRSITVLKRPCRVGIGVAVLAALCFGQQGPAGVYPTSHGVLKAISRSLLLVGVDDDHEMKFRITRKTKFFASQGKQVMKEIKASSLHPGQAVDVDMQSSLDGSFEAVRVTVESPNK
jgi:hypothetical protein